MKSLLVCEGKTDLIVISYYLIKEYGWQYTNNKDKSQVTLKIDEHQNEFHYLKENKSLKMISVGGSSRFEETIYRIKDIIANAGDNQNFNKIIIVTDKDNCDTSEIEKKFSSLFQATILNQEWKELKINSKFGEKLTIDVVLIIIPDNGVGAIESLLLNSIRQIGNDEDTIVLATEKFIDELILKKYLLKFRDRLKSKLSTVIGVLEPEKTFSHIDGMIKDLNWTVTDEVKRTFSKLADI